MFMGIFGGIASFIGPPHHGLIKALTGVVVGAMPEPCFFMRRVYLRVDLRMLQVFVIFAKLQFPPNSAAAPLSGPPAAMRYDSVLVIRRLRTPINCHC